MKWVKDSLVDGVIYLDAGAVLGSMPSGEEVAGLELPVFGAEMGPTIEKIKARPPLGRR